MFLRLFLLFTLVPLAELYLLIRLGTYIGAVDTILIVIGTGIAGGLLARSQGLAVLGRIQADLQQGQVPAQNLLDGVLILISAVMLVTPGLMTDAVGLCFLIPWTRKAFKSWVKRKLQARVNQETIQVQANWLSGPE